jgi:hypothetical protein
MCAVCELQANRLTVQNCAKLDTFGDFETFLRSNGPWLAALDFPFGQPFDLISNLAWPTSWEEYVLMIASMGKQEFEAALKRYLDSRVEGDKLHLRITDKPVGACSPMMLHRVPVGKMFFEGAPRLLQANVRIIPCRPVEDDRIVVEGYPALVARRFVGKQSYKSDNRGNQTRERETARRQIVQGLGSSEIAKWYGLSIELSDEMGERMVDDPQGDELDAVLCGIQGGWAWLQKFHLETFYVARVRSEGWIADPASAK